MFLSSLLRIQGVLFQLMRFWSDVGSYWSSAVDPCCTAVREDRAHPEAFTVSGPVLVDAGPHKYV